MRAHSFLMDVWTSMKHFNRFLRVFAYPKDTRYLKERYPESSKLNPESIACNPESRDDTDSLTCGYLM